MVETQRSAGRPRDAKVDAALLTSTQDLLLEEGFDRVSVDSVAARAGVGKAAIYRRWSGKTALVVAAVAELNRVPNDAGLAVPMIEDIARRYGCAPKRVLLDTNFATADDIVALATRQHGQVLVYAPPPPERDDVSVKTLSKRAAARAKEPEPLQEWRRRMASPTAQSSYKVRRRIELVNAHMKNRGLDRLNLRGLAKAKIVALWHALAHNILVINRLRLAHV